MLALSDRISDGPTGEHPAKGRVPAGETFAGDQNVRGEVPVLVAELPAGAAEAGHHLIHDQQDAVPVTDLPDLWASSRPAARWRRRWSR